MTSYSLLPVGQVPLERLRPGLAAAFLVSPDSVDVAPWDVTERQWNAAVLCTYRRSLGDVSWSLDVYVSQVVAGPPDEDDAARRLSQGLGVPVLYPAKSSAPSAWWLVEGDERPVRIRLAEEDGEHESGNDVEKLTVEAVDRPLASLPHAPVERQPEVILEYRVPTPLTDGLPGDAADERTRGRLAFWEALGVRMRAGWPPDGWFPERYFEDALETRDELVREGLSEGAAGVLGLIDASFREQTREVRDGPAWWWRRLPDPVPWGQELR